MRVKNCRETVGSQFLPRGIKMPRRALWAGAKESCTGAKRGFGGAKDSWGPKHLLHPLLTTLGTFEVSGPCSRTFGSQDKTHKEQKTHQQNIIVPRFGGGLVYVFPPIRNDRKHTHTQTNKQTTFWHPRSPRTIPQICLCLCAFSFPN